MGVGRTRNPYLWEVWQYRVAWLTGPALAILLYLAIEIVLPGRQRLTEYSVA